MTVLPQTSLYHLKSQITCSYEYQISRSSKNFTSPFLTQDTWLPPRTYKPNSFSDLLRTAVSRKPSVSSYT